MITVQVQAEICTDFGQLLAMGTGAHQNCSALGYHASHPVCSFGGKLTRASKHTIGSMYSELSL